MAVPDFQSIMLPLLTLVGDGKERSLRDAIEHLAQSMSLTENDRRETIQSGQLTFDNRVGWARTYLKKAGLLTDPRRGYLQITERGLEVLAQKPPKINKHFLRQFSEFEEFSQRRTVDSPTEETSQVDQLTPAEEIKLAYQRIRQELAIEILQTVKTCSPAFFERLVVDLLVKMGYGGTRKEAGRAIGSSGDGGIDGIINEDRLGLDVVYIQAKRWEASVQRPEVQKFAGALQGQRARKGVFITTSSFSPGATDYARMIETKIILIDGETLAQLMIDYNVGVATTTTYELKRIDSDYFAGEA